jgi:hypothetical protein
MDDFIEGLKLLLGNVLFGAVALLIIAAAIIFTGLAIWKIAIIAAELFKIDM